MGPALTLIRRVTRALVHARAGARVDELSRQKAGLEALHTLIAHRLERSGYDVAKARDGEEALRLARERTPALAVLDVMMPKLDGYTVTREIREGDSTRDMPVIILTARVQEQDVARGFEAGADDYLKKPFSPQELRARVQAVLGRS